jgi:tetratricopeptide (TPR) repeat protein
VPEQSPDIAASAAARAIALAEQHWKAGRQSDAAALCRAVLRARPDHPPALHLLGVVTYQGGDFPGAIDLIRRAIAGDGTSALYHHNLGGICREQGDLAAAYAEFDRAIALQPREPAHYLNIANLKKFSAEDAHLAMMQKLAREVRSLPAAAQIQLHFALGKAYDDLRQYEKAFHHLRQGNTLKRQQLRYDEAKMHSVFERVRSLFDRGLLQARSGAGCLSPVPVFVVGMPRSGTTLVEQILASHPAVYGAGEIQDFGRLLSQLVTTPAGVFEYPERAAALPAGDLHALGRRYFEGLRRRAAGAARIVDKMPSNFVYLGMIHLALPRARIIHIRRNPLDSCLSCYSRLFIEGLPYTYDLAELGRYYRLYAMLMAHWREVLPPDRLIEVDYEAIIADVAAEARKIVEFCGLPWDDRCAAFHQTDRPVRTASVVQVRQPIYRSSEGRWRAYRKHLGPLIAALGLT